MLAAYCDPSSAMPDNRIEIRLRDLRLDRACHLVFVESFRRTREGRTPLEEGETEDVQLDKKTGHQQQQHRL